MSGGIKMGNNRFDLLSLGEILLRLSPPDNERIVSGETFQKQVGGAELNVVSGVSILGLRTGVVSKLPDNALGIYAKDKVRFCGVSDDFLVYDDSQDARLGIYYYENGAYPRKPGVVYDRRHTSFDKISLEELPKEMFQSTRCFHAIEMIKRFKENGTLISFDVNFRGNLWTGPEAKACIEEILPYVDIFFCSEETARLTFLKEGDAKRIMKSFTQEYPISVVASTQRIVHSPKKHTFGSVIYSAKEDCYYEEEPYRNIEVVDRIGSGDAYVSGALYGLLAYDFDCQKALEYGNAAGAVKNTIKGDLPSCSKREMDAIIRNHKHVGPELEMDR